MKPIAIRLAACIGIAAAAVAYLVKDWRLAGDMPLQTFLAYRWYYVAVLLVAVIIGIFLVIGTTRQSRGPDNKS